MALTQLRTKDTCAAIKIIMNSNSNHTKFPKYFQINDMRVVDKKAIAKQFNHVLVNIGSKLAQTIIIMAFFNLELKLCGQHIKCVRQFIFLGITIHETLNWDPYNY